MLGYQFNAATPCWIILPEYIWNLQICQCWLRVFYILFLITDLKRRYANAIFFSASRGVFQKTGPVVMLWSLKITRYDTAALFFLLLYNYVRDGVDRLAGSKA